MRKEWRYAAAIAALTLVTLVRVATTHRVFSQVLDEPAHLAAGFEWFSGTYVLDASHPPLSRILGALPLKLAGYPKPKSNEMVDYGDQLLYHDYEYEKTLQRIRIPNLLLLAITLAATAAWARRAFGDRVAIITTALLGTLPPILGHAGVLTTDLAAMMGFVVALLALDCFLQQPSLRRATLLGLALGCGLLSKFSFLVFFPPCALVLLIARWRPRVQVRAIAIIAAIACIVTWAGYRFDFRTPRAYDGDHAVFIFGYAAPKPLSHFAQWAAEHVPIPAPAFAVGLGMVQAHNKQGHDAVLFGKVSPRGWWYYFPVLLFYKTPIPFLLLTIAGAALLIRERNRLRLGYVFVALAILLLAMTSKINIGVRHILPIYAPMAILAAHAIVTMWDARRVALRATSLALVTWLFIGVALGHPDYIAWFNEAAPRPARITVDSNLDWGQDINRLGRTVHELHVQHLYVDIAFSGRLDLWGIPVEGVPENRVPTGWFALSETPFALKSAKGEYAWLKDYKPVRRVGKSIRLYYIP
ncbi:MAG: glycosyltransferase family 39 protein [Acidobacteriota bacterium]|nr:glycosyltransferase family 39 protein [Acidobacteriota bacterium]